MVGLTHVNDTGDSGILNIRNEIALHLSHQGKGAIHWCAPKQSTYYQERREAMLPYLNMVPQPEDSELTSDLRFHINYIMLLIGCKLGPKLQAMYHFDDVIEGIIDSDTIFNVKKALGYLLLEMITTGLSGIEQSEYIWRFFDNSIKFFKDLSVELPNLFRRFDKIPERIQRGNFFNTFAVILSSYF